MVYSALLKNKFIPIIIIGLSVVALMFALLVPVLVLKNFFEGPIKFECVLTAVFSDGGTIQKIKDGLQCQFSTDTGAREPVEAGTAGTGGSVYTAPTGICAKERGDVVGYYDGDGYTSVYENQSVADYENYQNGYPIYASVAQELDLVEIPSEMSTGGKRRWVSRIALDHLQQAWESSNKIFTINSAYRSCTHQGYLVSKNNGGRVASVGKSPHQSGKAVDIGGKNNANSETRCTNNKDVAGYIGGSCSETIVNALSRAGFNHINSCNIRDGDFYKGTSDKADCVHFTLRKDIQPPEDIVVAEEPVTAGQGT